MIGFLWPALAISILIWPGWVEAKKRDQTSAQCCFSAEDNTASRCVEVLVRSDEPGALKETCKAIANLRSATNISQSDRTTSACENKSNYFSIPTEDQNKHGWWGQGPPDYLKKPPELVGWWRTAMSSEGCAKYPSDPKEHPKWAEAMNRCRKSAYEQVDIVVNMMFKADHEKIKLLRKEHPWSSSGYKDNVKILTVSSFEELKTQITQLLMECKIARHMILAVHGNPGALLPSADSKSGVITTNLISEVLACIIAPESKIQFTSCHQSCGKTAELLRKGIEYIVTSSRFKPHIGTVTAFHGTKFLFNPELGAISEKYFGIGPLEHSWSNIYSVQGSAIEYSVDNQTVKMDQTAPECPKTIQNSLFEFQPVFMQNAENPLIAKPF